MSVVDRKIAEQCLLRGVFEFPGRMEHWVC